MTNEQIIKGTLAWCNRQRAKQGKKPLLRLPKGKRHDPASCPCGKATGLLVYSQAAKKNDRSRKVVCRLPKSVRRFVLKFDRQERGEDYRDFGQFVRLS